MNGLRLIRRRCNYTVGSFAKEIGVSKQIVSEWETGGKPIPTKRKEQIANMLGISADLFGEISDEQKEIILNKAMFASEKDGVKVFSFLPPPEDYFNRPSFLAYFIGEDHEPSVEEFARVSKERKELISKIDTTSHGSEYPLQQDQITAFNRDIELYSKFLQNYQEIWDRKSYLKLPCFNLLSLMLSASQIAFSDSDENISPIPYNRDMRNTFEQDHIALQIKISNLLKEQIRKETDYFENRKNISFVDTEEDHKREMMEHKEWALQFKSLSLLDKIKNVEDNWAEEKKNIDSKSMVVYYIPK